MTVSQPTHRLILVAILVWAGAFRLALLNHPFERNAEGSAAFYGLLARNYFRYDLATTLGVPVMSMGADTEPIFYANHSPITPLLIAVVHAATGYRGGYDRLPGEWQVRLPTALFTLGCIVLIYHLLARRTGPRPGLIAAALFAALPITLIYGGFPDVINPQLIFFVLLSVAAYERFYDGPNPRWLAWLSVAFLGAALMDWPAFYLLPVLGIHFLCTRRPRQWPWIVAFGLIGLALFAALYAYLAVVQHNWRWMGGLVQHRALSNVSDTTSQQFGVREWLYHAVWLFAIGRHTLLVTALALAWLPLAVRRRFRGRADRLTSLLLAWAMVHILVGRQGVYQHEWWWWPLTPGLVIAAALALEQFFCWLKERARCARGAVNLGASVLLIAFAAWNMRAALIDLSTLPRMAPGPLDYTTVELGQTIREHVAPDAAVVLAESDTSLPLWYYADRAIKRPVWDRQMLAERLADQAVELSFETIQPWHGRVDALIIPRAYLSKGLESFAAYLDARYKRQSSDKFLIYELAGSDK